MTAQEYLLANVCDANRAGVYALLWILNQHSSPDLLDPDVYVDSEPCCACVTWNNGQQKFVIMFNPEDAQDGSELSWAFGEQGKNGEQKNSYDFSSALSFEEAVSRHLQYFKKENPCSQQS